MKKFSIKVKQISDNEVVISYEQSNDEEDTFTSIQKGLTEALQYQPEGFTHGSDKIDVHGVSFVNTEEKYPNLNIQGSGFWSAETDSGYKLNVEGWKPKIGDIVLFRDEDCPWIAGELTGVDHDGVLPNFGPFQMSSYDYYDEIAKFDPELIGKVKDVFRYNRDNIHALEYMKK